MRIENVTYWSGLLFVGLVLAVGIALYCSIDPPAAAPGQSGLALERLIYALVGAFCFAAVVLLSALGAVIIIKMAVGSIDLKYLVAEQDGAASLSRFQMLLFTFVIAALYFLYSLFTLYKTGASAELPTIPGSVLGLMGISGGSYLLSKGIQAASDSNKADDGVDGSAPVRKNIK
jgi:hypothetical protein